MNRLPEEYKNKKNFQHLGYRIDVRELYSVAYLAVFPSYYREGGWPRGLTEPMAMGIPVITADNKHSSGAVIDGVNGLIVPIKDSKALAEGIETIVNDESKAKEFGVKSRQKTIDDLNEELIMQELVEAII